MHTPTRMQALSALLLLMGGMLTLQAAGALISPLSAETATQSSMQSSETESTTAPNATSQVTLGIQPSSSTISAGAYAKFAVQVVDTSTAEVFLAAGGLPPDSVAIFTPNFGVANPTLNSTLTIVTSVDTAPGNYSLTAVATLDGKESTTQVSLQILAPASVTATANTNASVSYATTLTMTVTTDQTQYQPNSTVNIQGQVTDSTGSVVTGATVSIQVDAATGVQLFYTNNLQTDTAGVFQTPVSLPDNSPTGTYTIFASASKPGYSNITSRTTFVVGASTTPSVIIKAVYTGDSTGNPMSTFTSGQTIWVWVVIENFGATFQGVVWIQVRDPNGVPVQIQIHIAKLGAGETVKDGLGFALPVPPTIGVYTVTALVSDKLISQGGIFLASAETQFDLTG